MVKPAKKSASKLPPKNKKRLIIVAIIAACMLLVAALFVIQRSIYEHEKAILRDDITFARYETFIDLVKQRLDTEMPEGKWVIDKYCDYANQKASDPLLGCDYAVQASTHVDNEKFYEIIASFSEDGTLTVPTYSPTSVGRHIMGKIPAHCTSWGSNEDIFARVSCGNLSLIVRYPLTDQ